jgi:hypothetical protein
VAEPAGDLARTIAGICRDDVEGCPIDALERQRGVAQLAAEPRTDHLHGLGEEVVDAGGDLRQQLAQATWRGQQAESAIEPITGQEADP